jgi:CheY-like chemotaxis protein/AraC-like DNA-binding protein
MTDGLCNNSVTDIEQDPYGILWVSTDAGISRYDGMTFYTRSLADKEPVALANLMNTPDGLTWSMAKFRPRICCFNRMTGYFVNVVFDGEDIQSRLLNIRTVGDDLLGVTPQALYRLKAQLTDNEVHVTAEKLLTTQDPFVNLFGQEGTAILPTAGRDLVLYTLQSGRTEHIPAGELLLQDPSHIRHSYLGDHHLWLCSDREGLICYDLNARRARHITVNEPENDIHEARVIDMARMSETAYLVSTRSSILRLTFDDAQLTQAAYHIDDLTPERHVYGGLLNERINCIYLDNHTRTLWVGTQGGGLMKLRLWSDDVFHIPAQREMGRINHIEQGAMGYIWVATETGLFRSDTREISPQMHFTRWRSTTFVGSHSMCRDGEYSVWIGNEHGDVIQLNTLNGEEVLYHPLSHPDAVRRLWYTDAHQLWMMGDSTLTVYDPKTRETLLSLSYKEMGYEVTYMAEDSDGAMWLGTTRGLKLATLNDHKLSTTDGYEQQLGMNPGYVRSLYINRYNTLFAAYTNKIITIDDKDKRVTGCLLVNRELLDGHVQCMMDDRNGNTWMGSNTGISTYNNRTGQVYHYDASNNYFDVAYLSDGELIWANATGLLYFAPRKVKAETNSRQLRFSSIEVNNVKLEIGREVNGQVILDRPAYLIDKLELDADNNNLDIIFTNMKYTTNPGRVFYRLLPDDTEWHTGWQGRVKLSALKAGHYTLEVRPPMPFEVETEVLTLPIHVRSHWFLTVWAFALYALLILGCGLGIHLYLQRKAARRHQHITEKEDLEEALDEEKGRREETVRSHRLRDNIHHTLAQEMRSPLSMAIVPLKELTQEGSMSDEAQQKARIAYHNAVYLQDICNQILNIYQMANSEGLLEVAPYTLSELADDAVRTSHDLLNVSEVTLDYDKTVRREEEVWADRSRITFILSNALSNAFRRIAYSGTVQMRIELAEIDGMKCGVFAVRDEAHNNLSQPFSIRLGTDDYSSLENQLHPEIGLEAMRDAALEHDGDIVISHEQGHGTDLRLYLPLGRTHFEGRTGISFGEPDILVPDEEEVTEQIEAEERNAALTDERPLTLKPVTPETKFKVLVIEDNADIRLYLKVLLATRYNVVLAENGQEGIRVARKEEPDLILMDIMMPVMDGLQCCSILKEDLKTCHIPVIMLTALTSDEDVMKGLDTGADDYILKPFNPDILRSKIKNLIQSRVDLKRIYTRMLMTTTPSTPDDNDSASNEPRGIEDPFIVEMLDQVRAHMQDPDFNVKRLAETMNMSQPTLYRKVKQLTNYSIIELIRGVRLKEAAELLKSKKYSVQEVAERVGYNDVPTFRKHFIDLYGTTPSNFNS